MESKVEALYEHFKNAPDDLGLTDTYHFGWYAEQIAGQMGNIWELLNEVKPPTIYELILTYSIKSAKERNRLFKEKCIEKYSTCYDLAVIKSKIDILREYEDLLDENEISSLVDVATMIHRWEEIMEWLKEYHSEKNILIKQILRPHIEEKGIEKNIRSFLE